MGTWANSGFRNLHVLFPKSSWLVSFEGRCFLPLFFQRHKDHRSDLLGTASLRHAHILNRTRSIYCQALYLPVWFACLSKLNTVACCSHMGVSLDLVDKATETSEGDPHFENHEPPPKYSRG